MWHESSLKKIYYFFLILNLRRNLISKYLLLQLLYKRMASTHWKSTTRIACICKSCEIPGGFEDFPSLLGIWKFYCKSEKIELKSLIIKILIRNTFSKIIMKITYTIEANMCANKKYRILFGPTGVDLMIIISNVSRNNISPTTAKITIII